MCACACACACVCVQILYPELLIIPQDHEDLMYLKLVSYHFAEAFGPQLHSKAGLKVVTLKLIGLQIFRRMNKMEIRVIQAIITHIIPKY